MGYGISGKDPRRWYANRRRFIGAGLGAGFSAAFLAACGGSNNNNNKPANTNTNVGSASASATRAGTAGPSASSVSGTAVGVGTAGPSGSPAANAAASGIPAGAGGTPKRGGRLALLVNYSDHANHEVMMDAAGAEAAGGDGIVYSQLIRRKYAPDLNSTTTVIPVGDIAASWSQPDPQTFIFKVRPDAKWQNIAPVSGRKVTADDVVYSVNRQIALKVDASYWASVQDISAPDPATVQVKLKKIDPDFLVACCSYFNKVLAKEAVDVHGDLKDGPVIGSGPWIFKNWVPNQIESFDKNPDFYEMAPDGKAFPYADGLDSYRIADISTYVAAFTTGKLDTFAPPDRATRDSVVKANPKVVSAEWSVTGPLAGRAMMINAAMPPTNDKRARQGLQQAIDRDGLAKVLNVTAWYGGQMIAASDPAQLLPEATVRKAWPYDPKAAKQLLDAAGVTSSFKPEITTYVGQAGSDTAAFIQQNLKAVGLDSTIFVMDNPALTKWFVARDKQFVPFIRGTSITGVNNDIVSAYRSDGARNMAHMNVPAIDALLDQQSTLLDNGKRNQLIQQILQMVNEDFAMSELYSSRPLEVYQPRLHGYTSEVSPGSVDHWVNMYLWLDQG